GRHLRVATVDFGIVKRGLIHSTFQVVRDDEPRQSAKKAEHAHMRPDPVCWPGLKPALANSRSSRMSSVRSAAGGQPIPAFSARLRLSWIVLRATPSARPISRALAPS